MDKTPEKYTERLNELLRKKKAMLLDILTLTLEQAEVINEDSLDSLNKLIEEKQLKIDAIIKIDEEFEIYFQRFKSIMGISHLDQLDISKLNAAAIDGARQLKELTAGILDVIKSINVVEEANNLKSKKLLNEFGNQIKKINQSKKANNAYAPGPVSAPSYFLDKKK
jgi:hypothetical protein